MNRLEIEKKIKYWEKMRDYYTANDRQKKRIQRDINKFKKLLDEVSYELYSRTIFSIETV